jgi:hypothetical protein
MHEMVRQEVSKPMAEMVPLAGNLREYFLPELLYHLHEKQQTGTLVFALGEFKKALVYSQGEIVFASSNLKEDSLGEALVRSGTISLNDYALAESQVNSNIRFGEALIKLGCIDEQTLVQGLTYQMHSITYSVFLWPAGQFRFAPQKLPSQKFTKVPLSTLDTILRGTTLIRSWAELRQKLPSLDLKLSRAPDYETRLTKLKLHDSERRILDILQSEMPASDICVLSPVNEFETCRFLVACLITRLLDGSPL